MGLEITYIFVAHNYLSFFLSYYELVCLLIVDVVGYFCT